MFDFAVNASIVISTICVFICFLLVLGLFIAMILIVFHRHFPLWMQRGLCKRLGWHDGERNITGFDGASIHATCSICGKAVMMDSQGNWL